MDGYTKETLRRLSLAQAVICTYRYMFHQGMLDHVYETYRGRGYERELKFGQVMDLFADALFVGRGSGKRSFQHAKAQGSLPVSEQAAHGKIRRLPLDLSCALLLQGEICPALNLLELYRRRGGIEHLFQKPTRVFNTRHPIGSTPQASIFQAPFRLPIFNLLQVVRAHVAQGQRMEMEEVALEKPFNDATEEPIAPTKTGHLSLVMTAPPRARTAAAMRKRLRRLLANQWRPWWRKAPPKKKPSRPTPKGTSGQHTSMYRLPQAQCRRRARARRAARRPRVSSRRRSAARSKAS